MVTGSTKAGWLKPGIVSWADIAHDEYHAKLQRVPFYHNLSCGAIATRKG
jgi:hypothetical protein